MKYIVIALVLSFVGVANAAKPAKVDAKGNVISVTDLKFEPMDPKNLNMPEYAQSWGNPWTGPSVFYMKLKKGASPIHKHTAGYHGVVIKGTTKHWAEGEDQAAAKVLAVGSTWFQPGNQFHGDECLDDSGCIVVLDVAGKFDFAAKEQPKEGVKK